MSARVAIDVAASTSNLGAGFDCIGMAIDLWLRVHASLEPGVPARPGDRLWLGFAAACRAAGLAETPDVSFEVATAIPIGRGLGSSASATVAGALAANQLLHLELGQAALLRLCSDVEGHADNVAPALAGGATLVTREGGGYRITPLDIHPGVGLVFAIPDFILETRLARAILPEFVPHRVAAGAAARAAALVRGLACADAGLLATGLDDVLHVPFRRRLVPGYTDVTRAARAAGAWGATLSGAGSSIVALAPHRIAASVGRAMRAAWDTHHVASDVIQPSIVREIACL